MSKKKLLGIIVACIVVVIVVAVVVSTRGGGAEPFVERAREDLAHRTGVDKSEITVVKVEAVDWPDTSLGCPQPDMLVLPVITPGYKIVLSCAGETHVYHSDRGTRVVYCPRISG